MPSIIKIGDFKGVFTNADTEDLPVEYLTIGRNVRPWNGRLVKTYGPALKISDTVEIDNLATFIHRSLGASPHFYNKLEGRLYIGVYINNISNEVTLYGYDYVSETWVDIHDLTEISSTDYGPFYHKKFRNPCVQVDSIMRVLPGNVSLYNDNDAIGIWIGEINRTYWDGLVGYHYIYVYPITIDKPELGLVSGYDKKLIEYTHNRINEIQQDERYYFKFSYIYDGIQESLLSDEVLYFDGDIAAPALNQWYEILFSINKTTFNKRITSLKVYRSETHSGPYYHIHTIDYLRPSDKIKSAESGAYNGVAYVYIPDLSTYSFNTISTYRIKLDGTWHNIDNPGDSTGYDVFHFTADTITSDKWDEDWILEEDGVEVEDDTAGAYSGHYTQIISEELDEDYYDRGILVLGTGSVYIGGKEITKYHKKAIHTNTVDIVQYADYQWRVMSVVDGLYFAEEVGDYVNYRFYDIGLGDGAEHPLAGEVSIKANGDIAMVIGGRLWQANPVLDPGDKNEERIGKVCYSELEQYDINPVSNLISLPDREGGAVTGMGEILGNPVFTKPHAIHTIDISHVYPPPFPVIKSEHNIGNIARNGLVQVGEALYPVYYDAIYRMLPNNLAESDDTPTERLKISEPIGDTYNSLSVEKKEAIEARYDQRKGEIVYKLGEEIWVFNVDRSTWRQLESDITFSIMTYDENADIIIYDNTDEKVYTLGGDDFVGILAKLKDFRISDERYEVVRHVTIIYKSVTALTLRLYTEYSDTEAASYTLPASGTVISYKIEINNIKIETS